MSCKIFFAVALILFGCCLVNARGFYVEEPGDVYRERYRIPTYPAKEMSEQASRDLDLSFSAGDPEEMKDVAYPAKKVYAYAPSEGAISEQNRREYPGVVRPAYYKDADSPSRRMIYRDQSPGVHEQNRKLVKLNDGSRRGELLLELRVIANNNENAM